MILYKEVMKSYDYGLRIPDDVCLTWCDDVHAVRRVYIQRGYAETLFIDDERLKMFACRTPDSQPVIFVQHGSWLPGLTMQMPVQTQPGMLAS